MAIVQGIKEKVHLPIFDSIRVAPGERLAVVGWTGAGKSTLIRLLARLYDVQEGRILLDGVDVRAYDLDRLRRTIGVVLQDHFLFAGTIAGNIGLDDPGIDRAAIVSAARTVRADRFIERPADQRAQVSHQIRSRHPFPRNITDQEVKPFAVGLVGNHIAVIAADGTRRSVAVMRMPAGK